MEESEPSASVTDRLPEWPLEPLWTPWSGCFECYHQVHRQRGRQSGAAPGPRLSQPGISGQRSTEQGLGLTAYLLFVLKKEAHHEAKEKETKPAWQPVRLSSGPSPSSAPPAFVLLTLYCDYSDY